MEPVTGPTTAATPPRPREIWTRLTVDPLADPLSRVLARLPGVTPNAVTGFAVLCALTCAAAFATGHLRVGGALFLLRFFSDCLDGKVARLQGVSSARGALLDLSADVGGIALVTASLSSRLVHDGRVDAAIPLALLASMVFYNWILDHRKSLAARAGLGDGGADHSHVPSTPVWGRWVAFCRRLNMSPVPWALEVEILVLGMGPLVAPREALPPLLGVGLAFYVVADVVNLRRTWRLAHLIDLAASTSPPAPEEPRGHHEH